jgi:hypothetical protein
MISEANGSDKAYTVTEEQFAQVLTRATNLWYLIPVLFCILVIFISLFTFEFIYCEICINEE